MGFDNGLWRTASKVGAYRHVVADPATGQLGLFATMDENGRGLTMGTRIRLENGLITEVELAHTAPARARRGTTPASPSSRTAPTPPIDPG